MLAYKGLPSLQWAVFVGFERKNAHRSRPLEIIGLSKVSTYEAQLSGEQPVTLVSVTGWGKGKI